MKGRILIFVLVCICALLLGSGEAAIAQQKMPPNITILLLGTQSSQENARSADAIVLACMRLDTGAVSVASIRRDLLVKGPGNAAIKLSAAAKDGPQAVVDAVNGLFQLNIAHFVMVDLAGMEKIIDGLGGIALEIGEKEWRIESPDGNIVFHPAGLQALSGAQALLYMKAPSGEGAQQYGSHISRVLSALMEKALKLDMEKLVDLISDLLPYVETNMSLMNVLQIAGDALSVPVSGIKTGLFPAHGQEEAYGKETAVRIENGTAEAEAIYSFLYGP